MDYCLLGPLEVLDDDSRQLSIGAGRQRALLALLLLRANEPVASDRLIEELWGESPPATAHKMLHNQVSALRRALGQNGRLETLGSAYRLKVQRGELDVARFEELADEGRGQVAGDPAAAVETLRKALALWRGPALSDVAYEPFAQGEIARLEEERWAAFEARTEAELALGRHAELVGQLEAAVAEQPLRERLHGQLMLALYRCGRQAEALEAFKRARTTLVEQIGVEPGADLRKLQEAILAQDPALDAVPQGLPPALEGGSPLLAGRGEELARLSERLAEARAGHGGVAVVHGPPGIGKTRLAAELARAALSEGMAVLYLGADAPPAAVDDAVAGARPTLAVIDEPGPELLGRVAALTHDATERRVLWLVVQTEPGKLEADPVVGLGPLGPEAVAEIARLYLPAGGDAGLAAESGGGPATVHRLAAARARQQAAE
ncbi:MAG: BTAD domain-containing putative transcriptional regulator, partial [Thermoleophilaceae bacterium]